MTIDDQIRSIVREEIGNTLARVKSPTPWALIWAFGAFIGMSIVAFFSGKMERDLTKRLDRLESRSVSEITVIHPDRRLERVVEPWGGGL